MSRNHTKFAAAMLLVAFMLVSMNGAAAAAPVKPGGIARVVGETGDRINIRSTPSTAAEINSKLAAGEAVEVYDGPRTDANGNVWYKVRNENGSGWMSADYLAPKTSSTTTSSKTTSSKTATLTTSKQQAAPSSSAAKIKIGAAVVVNGVADSGLRIRSAANSSATVLAKVDPGTVLRVNGAPLTDKSGAVWYPVNSRYTSGYVAAEYVSASKAAAPQLASAKTAAEKAATTKLTADKAAAAKVASEKAAATKLAADKAAAAKAAAARTAAEKAAAKVAADKAAAAKVAADKAATAKVAADKAAAVAVVAEQRTGTSRSERPAEEAQPQAEAPVVEVQLPAAPAPAAPAPAVKPAMSEVASNMLDVAYQYIGYRYVYAGNSPRTGFDCSGFIQYVMNKNGWSIGHSLSQQLNSGPRIAMKDLQPGDLVFFKNTFRKGLSHVGMYIGNGKFVHAESERTGVLISNLHSNYYTAHYYAATRPTR